jgi:hypothetical protein
MHAWDERAQPCNTDPATIRLMKWTEARTGAGSLGLVAEPGILADPLGSKMRKGTNREPGLRVAGRKRPANWKPY